MVELTKTITIRAPLSLVYRALTNYPSYPKYMRGIVGARIHKRLDKSCALVVYKVSMFGKDISYTLRMEATPEKSLRWTLEESKYLTQSVGSWSLKSQGKQKTSVTYQLSLELALPIPSFLVKKGAKEEVDQLLSQFKTYCESQSQ